MSGCKQGMVTCKGWTMQWVEIMDYLSDNGFFVGKETPPVTLGGSPSGCKRRVLMSVVLNCAVGGDDREKKREGLLKKAKKSNSYLSVSLLVWVLGADTRNEFSSVVMGKWCKVVPRILLSVLCSLNGARWFRCWVCWLTGLTFAWAGVWLGKQNVRAFQRHGQVRGPTSGGTWSEKNIWARNWWWWCQVSRF